MTETESMFSNMGVHSQPCGIKRTIDQVAEDSPADFAPCQPWQKQPVPYAYHSKRDHVHQRHEEPVYSTRSSDVVDNRQEIFHHQPIEPVPEVYTGDYFTPTSVRTFNTFKYGYDEAYSAKDEINNQHNEAAITYEQQSEVRHRRNNFSNNRPYGECKKTYEEHLLIQNVSYNTHEQPKTDEKYWSFGWNTNCPKKTNNQVYYNKPNAYSNDQNYNNRDVFQNQPHVQVTEQIQCDENGKSYLELSGKTTAFTFQEEWRSTWNSTERQYTYSQQGYGTTLVDTSEENKNWQPQAQSNYRHQRLSILSLSMFKLNRFRQCSDPSLHKSVLICNTLRHIEDEMEREESFTRRPKVKARAYHSSYDSYHQNDNTYDSNNGNAKVLHDRHSNVSKKNCEITNNQYAQDFGNPARSPTNSYTYRRNSEFDKTYSNLETAPVLNDKSPAESHMEYDIHSNLNVVNNEEVSKFTSMVNAEPQKCLEEINREIDWGSVLMSSAGFECFNSNVAQLQQTQQTCTRSDYTSPDFFTNGAGQVYDESTWKNNQFASNVAMNQRHNLSEFTVLRRRSELADELDGFVQILVGS